MRKSRKDILSTSLVACRKQSSVNGMALHTWTSRFSDQLISIGDQNTPPRILSLETCSQRESPFHTRSTFNRRLHTTLNFLCLFTLRDRIVMTTKESNPQHQMRNRTPKNANENPMHCFEGKIARHNRVRLCHHRFQHPVRLVERINTVILIASSQQRFGDPDITCQANKPK